LLFRHNPDQPDFETVKKIRSYHYGKAFLFLLLVSLISATCSTTKNTFVTRNYHNMTARYNGYFYARESMKEAQSKIEKSYADDYSQLLPVFRLPNTPETKGCFVDLEKAIKKSSGVIEHHAIVKKGTNPPQEIPEAGKWIDDSYLIIGQAHYYKGENLAALEVFDYIIQKYAKFESRYDAIMWKARTQIEMGAYSEAESLLDVIANDKSCPAKLIPEIKASYAHLYCTTGNNVSAIKNLEDAIELTKNKRTKARFIFILAQLYEITKKNTKAYNAYSEVVALHPQYDMYFNAKLSQARLSASDSKNRTASKKELQKMLGDGKNVEFQDQIFYTLAQLEMGSGNKTAATNYYRQSIAVSVNNNKQKALSYLALGDIYFDETNYKSAQSYYDSTMMFLPKEYPRYKSIDEKQKSLTNLVRYINIVSTEDSLQKIVDTYGSDTTKLYAYIDKLIAKEKADEKRRQELEELKKNNAGGTQGGALGGGTQGGAGAWYFYNSSTVSFGINEFNRKWGNRKAEDNWRRANKETIMSNDPGNTQDTSSVAKDGGAKKNDKLSRDFYVKNLPFKEEDQLKSDEKIADALYNLGSIYKEQMNNNTKSIEAFEALCSRFPSHKYSLPSHFQLYRIYTTTNNTAKATEHKDYVCNKFPDSEYCSLILNPENAVVVQSAKKGISVYYDSTYALYLRKNYPQVINRCNYADSTYGTKPEKNPHVAKFAYLRAVSLGKTQGTPAMESALVRLLTQYPKDPIKPQAQALLDAIRKQNGGSSSVIPSDSAKAPEYLVNPNTEFQYMVVIETGKGDLNKFRSALSDLNTSSFGSSNLNISTVPLDSKHQCVLVKRFPDQKAAITYYNTLKTHPEIFANLTSGSFLVVVISTENYALFFKDKRIDLYKGFFEKNILPVK
jgi:tetratricopeptide (TPR) repeat protein